MFPTLLVNVGEEGKKAEKVVDLCGTLQFNFLKLYFKMSTIFFYPVIMIHWFGVYF